MRYFGGTSILAMSMISHEIIWSDFSQVQVIQVIQVIQVLQVIQVIQEKHANSSNASETSASVSYFILLLEILYLN